MPGLFPVWSDTLFRVVLVGVALAIPGVFVFPMIYVRTPYNLNRNFEVDQPVEFDHRHHVQDDAIPCLYCHADAERSPYAGVPATEVCMGCHSQIWSNSPMLEPVRRSYFSGQPIFWNRVHSVPDFVYFNHAVHVVRGRIGCERCHGDVATMPRVRQVELLTMGFCLDCHRQAHPPLMDQLAALPRPLEPEGLSGPAPLTNCTRCHR